MSLKPDCETGHSAHGLTREEVMRMARQHKTQRAIELSSAIREAGGIGNLGAPLPDAMLRRSVQK